jgi:hypothetical protein
VDLKFNNGDVEFYSCGGQCIIVGDILLTKAFSLSALIAGHRRWPYRPPLAVNMRPKTARRNLVFFRLNPLDFRGEGLRPCRWGARSRFSSRTARAWPVKFGPVIGTVPLLAHPLMAARGRLLPNGAFGGQRAAFDVVRTAIATF